MKAEPGGRAQTRRHAWRSLLSATPRHRAEGAVVGASRADGAFCLCPCGLAPHPAVPALRGLAPRPSACGCQTHRASGL